MANTLKKEARELQRLTGWSYQACHNHLRGKDRTERQRLIKQARAKAPLRASQ